MPYDLRSFETLVTDSLHDLEKEKSKSQKVILQIKLLTKIKTILNGPKEEAEGLCNAINCLEDGGYFSHKMIRLLVKLLPETSCGHTAILSALSLYGDGIEFSEFIDLMTRGNLKNGQLFSERKMYFDICPQLDTEAIIQIRQVITEKALIKMIMQDSKQPTGLYLFTGAVINCDQPRGHIFVFIKGNNSEYYLCDAYKEFSKDSNKILTSVLINEDGFEYKVLFGTYIYPFSTVQKSFNLRLEELSGVKKSVLTSPSSLSTQSSTLSLSSISDAKLSLSTSALSSRSSGLRIHYPPGETYLESQTPTSSCLESDTPLSPFSPTSGLESPRQVTTSMSVMVGRNGPGHGLYRVASPSTSIMLDRDNASELAQECDI